MKEKLNIIIKKSFSNNNTNMIIQNNNLIKIVKNYTQIRFYKLIKYNQIVCEKGLNAKEYTFLFNVIELILKYGKEPNNDNDELNIMFSKISGLKKKRLLKMITEFNFVIHNKINAFVEELAKNEDKKFSEILLKKLLPFIQKLKKNENIEKRKLREEKESLANTIRQLNSNNQNTRNKNKRKFNF